MGKTKKKPILVIAGPGAGKTHDMVDRVMEAIPSLKSHRILAVITYTNAATANIKRRLAKRIDIPPNVFIGTIHSFCYQFIFKPFGRLSGILPSELLFMNIDYKSGTPEEINIRKRKNLQKGFYNYDQILTVSSQILDKNKYAREVIRNRLQNLFIDEFQDSNITQFNIFESIRSGQKTDIYAVGDPEQFIFRFSIKKKKNKYSSEDFAINKFKNKAVVQTNEKNRRSCDQVVKFINHFHCDISQKSVIGSHVNGGVYFISKTDLDDIIKSYRTITSVLKKNDKPIEKFYLSYAKDTIGEVASKWGLVPVSNDSLNSGGFINEAVKVICAVIGENGKQICEKYELGRIELRKKGLFLVKAVWDGKINNVRELTSFIENDLGLKSIVDLPKREYGECKFKRQVPDEPSDSVVDEKHMYSTIHKAKGLEADAVLVVAKNGSELKKWLMTDKKARSEENTDMCRLGYVAFSRAKTILCIACLKKIDKELEGKLEKLGVEKEFKSS